MQGKKIDRRSFLKANASVVTGLALANIMTSKTKAADEKQVRIGFVGTGGRGRGLMGNVLSIKGLFSHPLYFFSGNFFIIIQRVEKLPPIAVKRVIICQLTGNPITRSQ